MAEAERLEFVPNPELVVGLVGAVGTDLELIKKALKGELSNLDYACEVIRLSTLLEEIYGKRTGPEHEDARITRLMDQGDHFREVTTHPEAVAFLAVAAMKRCRESKNRPKRIANGVKSRISRI